MTRKQFVELVYWYGGSGDKAFDGEHLTDEQKEAVIEAWSTFQPDDSEEETDRKFASYYWDKEE